MTPAHAEASSACTVMGTGVGKMTLGAVGMCVAVYVAHGNGRRTSTVALARCRAPRLNRFVLHSKIVMRAHAAGT